MDTLLSPFSRSFLLQRADSTAQIGMHDVSLDTALDGPSPCTGVYAATPLVSPSSLPSLPSLPSHSSIHP